MKRNVYINDDESTQELYRDNRISNRKYTILNFIPKNLWEQFSRFMNQYFLLIACLQLWPLITPVNPASTWGPLIFIFAVSATKEAWDDYNRYLSDKKANEKEVWVVKQGIKKHIQAQDIHVGDMVWLRENDEVPCDLVLLGTSDPQGVCYIETSALDGETDLKTRVIPSACMGIDPELLHKIKGVIESPSPNKDIRRFDANLRLFPPFIDNDICPLTIKNTLLQSCYLRNTEWACGVAIYTGNETKLGMSRGIPEPKLTAVDAMIDKLTGAIFVFQIVVVTVLGIAGNVWKDTEAMKQWYVLYPKEAPWYELLIIPLRFELLCSIMIPISIKVSLDLVKSLYAKFIDWDHEMMDQETSISAHAANTAISEDLGQVEYILTDKTGTLTENKMIFKRCCISGIYYGNESGDALKDSLLYDAVANDSPDIIRSLMVMAMCNTIIPTQGKSGEILYKSQSQDEEALVQAAAHLNMVLFQKNANILELRFNSSTLHYEVLDILEFTSERKRMSVVLRDCKNGKIVLLSKGAQPPQQRRKRKKILNTPFSLFSPSIGTCDQMPAQPRSPDRQNDDALLHSSPLHHGEADNEAVEEEEKEVVKVQPVMEPPPSSCSRSVSEATEAEVEVEEQRLEGVASVVKEDSDSSRDAEEELPEFVYIDLQVIRKEVQCPICLGIIKKTRTVMECLHRFCRECIDKSMRMGNNECPACRTHCASRRSLRDDSRYDALIAALFPDIEKYEAEELAFCEEEKTRNKQIQASIAQIIKRQSEALGKKRSSRKGTGVQLPSTSQRNIRENPSRRSKRKRGGKSEFESDDDEDLENAEGQTSSYSGEQYKEVDQRRQISRRRVSSHSFSPATSSGGLCKESKLEHRMSYPGTMWNIEMRTWGKNGARSGHVRKNPQSTHLAKFKEFLQNFEKKDDQYATSEAPSRADKQLLAANEPPQAQGSHNKQDTLHLSSNIEDDKGRLSEVVDQFRDRLQLSEEKILPGFEANCISRGGQLILACQQKETT